MGRGSGHAEYCRSNLSCATRQVDIGVQSSRSWKRCYIVESKVYDVNGQETQPSVTDDQSSGTQHASTT